VGQNGRALCHGCGRQPSGVDKLEEPRHDDVGQHWLSNIHDRYGFFSDGSSSALTLNTSYSSFTQLTQNSAHLNGWALGTAPSGVVVLWGRQNSSGTFSAAANSGGFQLRLATSSADLPATGAVVGYFSGNRTGVSADSLYLNASLVGSPNSTTTGVGSGNAQLLESNGSFAPATVTIAISHFGSAMSSTDETNACRAFGAYLVSLGAIGSSPC
jgi:hypothetical protein